MSPYARDLPRPSPSWLGPRLAALAAIGLCGASLAPPLARAFGAGRLLPGAGAWIVLGLGLLLSLEVGRRALRAGSVEGAVLLCLAGGSAAGPLGVLLSRFGLGLFGQAGEARLGLLLGGALAGVLGGLFFGLCFSRLAACALRAAELSSPDAAPRAWRGLGLWLSLFGAAGAALSVERPERLAGLLALAAGVALVSASLLYYLRLSRWVRRVWGGREPALRLSLQPGRTEIPPLFAFGEGVPYDGVLLRAEGVSEGPYRGAGLEVAVARAPFEARLALGGVRRAAALTGLLLLGQLSLAASLVSRLSSPARGSSPGASAPRG